MKPLIIAAAAILPIVAAGLAGCAPIADTSYSSKVSNSRDFTRVGEVMLHVDVLENLPDCPGRACLPGKSEKLGVFRIGLCGTERLDAAHIPAPRL